jgi:hypothetical protein
MSEHNCVCSFYGLNKSDSESCKETLIFYFNVFFFQEIWSVNTWLQQCLSRRVKTRLTVAGGSKVSDKDDKLIFLQSPPSQNGWLIDIAAAQHMWRTCKRCFSTTLRPKTWMMIALRSHMVLFSCYVTWCDLVCVIVIYRARRLVRVL